jgi:hypothetical protein
MVAHHHAMKTRDNMSAVIEGLQRDHGLMAAYLEATDRIDWRALHKHKRVVMSLKRGRQISARTGRKSNNR